MIEAPPTLPKTPMNAGGASWQPINFEQACDFLLALAPGETRFTFQTFDDSGAERPELADVMHGSLVERLSELSHMSALGAGVFVTVNRTDLRGRRKANIVAVRALVADLDGAPLSVLERLGLPPHIIVITSPCRFHVYWKVETIATTDFKGLQQRLAALLGSDPTVCDLPRVMRLPGFPHQKESRQPARGLVSGKRALRSIRSRYLPRVTFGSRKKWGPPNKLQISSSRRGRTDSAARYGTRLPQRATN
jgi:hypothetical protein